MLVPVVLLPVQQCLIKTEHPCLRGHVFCVLQAGMQC
jgi:hypothetical protein